MSDAPDKLDAASCEKRFGYSAEDCEREAAFWAFEAEVEAAERPSVKLRRRLERVKLLVLKAMWAVPAAVLPLWWRLGVLVNRDAKGRRNGLVEPRFALKIISFEEFLFKRVHAVNRRLALVDLIEVCGLLLGEVLLDFKNDLVPFDAVADVVQLVDKVKYMLEGLARGHYTGNGFDWRDHAGDCTTEGDILEVRG